MYKVVLIFIALVYSSSAAAQHSIADKGTISLTHQVEEISAVAIPMDMAGQFILDADNYHKAVVTGVEPEMPGQLIEVTAQGTPAQEHVQGVAKEAITTGAIKVEEQTIIVTDRAQPVKPK